MNEKRLYRELIRTVASATNKRTDSLEQKMQEEKELIIMTERRSPSDIE